ncbi:hypothetical protein [Arthrobacter bambusae]|uniref:Uncharacterized protein n=1 Tax=Arthrobacter bambusae TaxID=1338426 RepID=A0AAW8DI14_9MICC|nr:hypothetical protein [Arthrobacter bambusae]MDP9905646.1 hypothetical protein [Arthrobacter bambusae]MDQ0127272.1 hypothetical protein [Arthrobacter bambusae]MDQ0178614.1 hypothetical protein [Arthrobacter bambusae]
MSDLVVFLAPRGIAAGVRETLSDWSERDLVDDFVWVEPGMISPTRIDGLLIAKGRMSPVEIQSLAGTGRYSKITLAVLVPALEYESQVEPTHSQRLVNVLETSFGSLPVLRIRLAFTRVGEINVLDSFTQPGWHNLLIAPEESSGPGLGHAALHSAKDPLDVGRHAAVACAGVLGLWRGSNGSPLDHEQALPGHNARLVRAFYRTLDTTNVEARLRTAVMSVDHFLPLPTHRGAAAIYIEDTALATKTMAEQLWAKHDSVLRGPREPLPQQHSRPVSAWAAIKMMFSFIWAALKNAPRSWVQRVVHKVKSDAAAAVHGIVFGSANSQYTVVVSGVTPDGLPASWLDIKEAADVLDKALDSGGVPPTHEPRQDLSVLWQDFAAGALTLADAGERVAALPPVQIGAQLAIVKSGRFAVPAAHERFTAVPPHLAAALQLDPVEPFDVLGIHNLDGRLQKAAADPQVGVTAGATLAEFRAWSQQHSDSYACKAGTRIGKAMMETTAEVQSLLKSIRLAADADEMLNHVLGKQKKLANLLKLLLLVLIVSLIAVGILAAFTTLGLGAASLIAAILAIGWGLGSFCAFLKGQRNLFQLMNQRTALIQNDDIARKNLRHALRDLRRQGETYSQFLAWSHIVATVLNEPFGRVTTKAQNHTAFIRQLPLNVKVGSAVVQPDAVGLAAAQIRRDIFNAGWLSTSWENAITGAAAQLGPKGFEFRTQPHLIFQQQADGPLSVLPNWIAILERDGIDRATSDDIWARVVRDLEGPHVVTGKTVLSEVQEVKSGTLISVPLDRFIPDVDVRDGQTVVDSFDGAVLSDVARNAGKSSVELSIPFQSITGLARRDGLVQFSAGIPEHEFLVIQKPEIPHWWDSEVPGKDDGIEDFRIPSGPTF